MRTEMQNKLEKANKLIFVRRYEEAERLLTEILSAPETKDEILVHLRRIELGTKLSKLPDLHREYLGRSSVDSKDFVSAVCLLFVEQFAEMSAQSEIIQRFQSLIKQFGPSAAGFYGIAFSLESMGNSERALYNYDQSIVQNPGFFPSYFGLSQLYYQQGNEKQGDHYFYMFEEAAPYNVYGNFETHRRLHREFAEDGDYEASETALTTLSEWWYENRNNCPPEIQIYEAFSLARLAELQMQKLDAEQRRLQGRALAKATIESGSSREGVLFFIARTLEEFDEHQLALQCYRKILRQSSGDPRVVQKIGSQFLSIGEFQHALELFQDAYQAHPDNPEVRFCLLVSQLKLKSINVEEYLMGKERLKQLVSGQGDKVEILSLLHTLLNKFQDDPDVQLHVGDTYLKLGNTERAARHFAKMIELDPLSRISALKFASFQLRFGDPELAIQCLDRIPAGSIVNQEEQVEFDWLRAHYFYRSQKHDESMRLTAKVLDRDPWNVSYLSLQASNQINIAQEKHPDLETDAGLESLLRDDEREVDWKEFDKATRKAESLHLYALTYTRRKLRFLYSQNDEKALLRLLMTACRFDAQVGVRDFIKLLNTNFDSPEVYWAIGSMQMELWQLETASFWFDQVLNHPGVKEHQKARALVDLADCFTWRNIKLDKAIEYAKLALDLGESLKGRAANVLAHSYLKAGQVREAQVYLDAAGRESDPELVYLRGLLQYRNGSSEKANEIWKPLLTLRSESVRFHHIKQDLLKYYFDRTPYGKAN